MCTVKHDRDVVAPQLFDMPSKRHQKDSEKGTKSQSEELRIKKKQIITGISNDSLTPGNVVPPSEATQGLFDVVSINCGATLINKTGA